MGGFFSLVLRRNVDPPVTRGAGVDLGIRPRGHLDDFAFRYALLELGVGAEDVLIILRCRESGGGKAEGEGGGDGTNHGGLANAGERRCLA